MLTRKQRWRRVRAVPVLLRPRPGVNYSWGNSCPCLGSTATSTTPSTIGTTAATTPPTTTTSTAPQLVLLQVSGRVAHPSSTALRSDNETPAARLERHQRQRRLPRSQPQPRSPSPSSSPTTQPKNAASGEPNHIVDDKANSLSSGSGNSSGSGSSNSSSNSSGSSSGSGSSSRNSRSPSAEAVAPGSDPPAAGNARRSHDPPTLPSPSSPSTPPPASTPTPTPTPTPVHPFHAWRVSALNLLGALSFFVTHSGYDSDGNGGGGCSGDYSGSGSSGYRGPMSGGPGARAQAWAAATATEGCRTSGTTRPRRCSSDEHFRSSPPSSPSPLPPLPPPPPPAPRGRVRFHHQIKVVLVASRGEMSSVKADVWWGERDYYDFRCAYIIAAREKAAIDQEAINCRKKMEAEMAAQAGASIPTEGEQDRVTTVETPGATSGSVSSSPSSSSPSSSLPSSSSLTPPQTAPGGGVGTSPDALLDDSGVCSSGVRALPSSSLLLPPPPPPTPEQERRHSLANEGNGESESSSVISGSGATSGITSGITSGTTIGSGGGLSGTDGTSDTTSGTSGSSSDVSGTGDTIGTTSSGSDSSGSGSVMGVAAGLSGGKIAGDSEDEKKGSESSSVISGTGGTSVTTSGTSIITSGTTNGNDSDVSGTGGTIGTTSSGNDSSGSGNVVGVAAGLPGGKVAGGREEETKGNPTVGAAATAATTERENLDPGLDQPDAGPKVLPAPAAAATAAAAVAAAAADGGVGGNMPSGEEMLPSGWDGGGPVKTATVATAAAPTAAATTTAVTPPQRQGRVQPWRVLGRSSASYRSEGVGGGAAVSGDGESGGDPTKDCATTFTPASSSRASSRSGTRRVMGKSAESASSPVRLSKSPPYLAGAAASAAAARAMSVPSAVFVDGGDGGGGGRKGNGHCRQAERESSVALKTRRNARNGKVPLPFLGDAPIRRVASF